MSEEKVTLQVFQKDARGEKDELIWEWKDYIPYYVLRGPGDTSLSIHLFPEKCPCCRGFIKPLAIFNPDHAGPIKHLQVNTTKPKLLILNLTSLAVVKEEGVIKIFISY